MRGTLIITLREWLSYFRTPVGYIVGVVFVAFNGYVFAYYALNPGAEASMRGLFDSALPLLLVFIMPMLTMRLMSEEFRSGTIESLMTTPISDAAVIIGKFLGAMAFYGCLLLTMLPYVIAIARHGAPDWGAVIGGFLGLLLLGGLYVSIGLLTSTCTSNQIIAVICSFAVLAVLALMAGGITSHLEGTARLAMQHLSVNHHYMDFVHGVLSLSSMAFFLTTTALMLFVSVKVLESRRWR